MALATVVCFKWVQSGFRDHYSAEHVNRLYEMVERNTSRMPRFVCVTDDPTGIRPEVETVKLWPNPAPHYGGLHNPNCFYRLKMFEKAAEAQFGERFVWIDLDALIVGSIDHILREPSDFRIWYVDGEYSKCNGSLVAHRCGTRRGIWEDFDPEAVDPKVGYRAIGFIGSDQAWIAQKLTTSDSFFGQRDGVYSYRCHVEGKPLPPDASIVFFHGEKKPDMLWHVPWIRRVLESLQDAPTGEDPARTSRKSVPRDKLRVVTWLWQPKPGAPRRFNAECVNVLHSMIDRHYRKPYEFVCVTDDATGIDGAVRTVPLWDDFADLRHPIEGLNHVPVCYRRLRVFAPEMADLIAPRFVSVDLDAVVLKDLTPLWERPEDFVAWHPGHPWSPYCGAMFMMNAGARAEVWTKFRANPARVIAEAQERGFAGTDQAVMALLLPGHEATWTASRDGIYAFRDLGYTEERERARPRRPNGARDLDRRSARADRAMRLESRLQARRGLPENTRLVMFNGSLKPWDEPVQRNFSWVRKSYKEIDR